MLNSSCGSGEKQILTCLDLFQRRPHCIKKAHSKSIKSCKPLCFITFCKPYVSHRDTELDIPTAPQKPSMQLWLGREAHFHICVFSVVSRRLDFCNFIFYRFFIMLITARETSSPQALKSLYLYWFVSRT